MISRIQFALNISFHILFPTVTIALGWVLVFFKYKFIRTKDTKWIDSYFLWAKIFALSFALGVVSGITMPFQFGTNWPGFMETVGNIAGPLLAYEVLTAFFLEATFLGIMLFAYNKVPQWLHTLATVLVSVGTTLSAFVILILVSWMVTPTGFEMREGIAHATSWYDIVFNPSMLYRLAHVLLTSGLTVSFLLMGISAYRWLRHDRAPAVLSTLRVGCYTGFILIIAQIGIGDLHGVNTAKHQPQTMAAMEGLWETEAGAPFVIFGIPNKDTQKNDYELAIPKLASYLIARDSNAVIPGIKDFPEHPPVAPIFYAFRIMVGVGLLMLLVTLWASTTLLKKKTLTPRLAKTLVTLTFLGWVSTLAGWYVTEIGRQPYLVAGVLKTADAVTKIPAHNIWGTFIAYTAVYAVMLPAYITALFFLARKAATDSEPPHKI